MSFTIRRPCTGTPLKYGTVVATSKLALERPLPSRFICSHGSICSGGGRFGRCPTRMPQEKVSNGQLASLLTTVDRPDQGSTIGFPSFQSNTRASGGPRLRDDPEPRTTVVVTKATGIPSHRRRGVAGQLADATGYPLPHVVCRAMTNGVLLAC
jgi:hypothetical protein